MLPGICGEFDAEASRVDIDFSHVETSRQVIVSDDGVGMTIKDFCEQFMSLGGSSKFGDGSRYGRIGIGSNKVLGLFQDVEVQVLDGRLGGK